MRHTDTLYALRLPDGKWLTIEEDFDNGHPRGIVICLAEAVPDNPDGIGETISRDPAWEPTLDGGAQ